VLVGAEIAPADRAARRLASGFAARAVAALVAVVDPARRRLALAAATGDSPVAVIALDRIRPVDRRLLERGRQLARGGGPIRCLGWAEALSGRSLDQRFFGQFRETLAAGIEALPRPIPRRDRHGLVLLELTRVLFLYFVQRRGWLDRRDDFLRSELDRVLATGGQVARRLFIPLFFGTLNRPPGRRSRAALRFGRIPFLNGGLFEAHRLERRWPDRLPDGFWRDAFDHLFERYHFTIGHRDDEPAGIGPDMLGRVFEGVMDPELRRETGAFYTPASLVDRVVGSALDRWLATRLWCDLEEARDQWQAPSEAALGWIRRVRVLDPAVGSGAFLLGALERLVRARVAAGESRSAATRSAIAANLFGVDLNPNAVHLAELRLWLAVIEADPDLAPEEIEPLPNLDALIRQGDSVFERVDLPFVVRPGASVDLGALRARVVGSAGADKRSALSALRRAELDAGRSAVHAGIEAVSAQIRELLGAARGPSLFGERAPVGRSDRAALRNLRRRLGRLRALERRLVSTGELPWFHYPSQFADVFADGGFDLVVGNPPWVRSEALSSAQREALKRRYRWFRGSSSGRPGFAPLPDLSVAFVERSLELLKPGGLLALLVPVKLATAQYGGAAREALARRTTIHAAADLAGRNHGFDALVYPLALLASRAEPAATHRVATTLDGGGRQIPQSSLGSDGWPLGAAPPPSEELVAAAAEGLGRLGEQHPVRLGVKTGADSIFLDPDGTIEPDLIRPAVRGRDIEAFRAVPSTTILWTHDAHGRALPALPPGAAHALARHRRQLAARADYRDGPPWTLFRIEAALARYRVVWPDLARDLTAAPLIDVSERRWIPLNTCYWIEAVDGESALALAAWLNASWIRALAKRRATVAASGFFRFNAGVVGALPLPAGALGDGALRRIGLAARQSGAVDQAALDDRVAELLGLGRGEPDRSADG